MTAAGDRVAVSFEAVFVEQIHNRVHPDHQRLVVELWDGTQLMLPIGAQVVPLEKGDSS